MELKQEMEDKKKKEEKEKEKNLIELMKTTANRSTFNIK